MLQFLISIHISLQNFAPVPYDKKSYGKFYSGDSYIVLNVSIFGTHSVCTENLNINDNYFYRPACPVTSWNGTFTFGSGETLLRYVIENPWNLPHLDLSLSDRFQWSNKLWLIIGWNGSSGNLRCWVRRSSWWGSCSTSGSSRIWIVDVSGKFPWG